MDASCLMPTDFQTFYGDSKWKFYTLHEYFLQFYLKSTKSQFKIDQKLMKNGPKIEQNCIKIAQKIDRKWTENGLKMD